MGASKEEGAHSSAYLREEGTRMEKLTEKERRANEEGAGTSVGSKAGRQQVGVQFVAVLEVVVITVASLVDLLLLLLSN